MTNPLLNVAQKQNPFTSYDFPSHFNLLRMSITPETHAWLLSEKWISEEENNTYISQYMNWTVTNTKFLFLKMWKIAQIRKGKKIGPNLMSDPHKYKPII